MGNEIARVKCPKPRDSASCRLCSHVNPHPLTVSCTLVCGFGETCVPVARSTGYPRSSIMEDEVTPTVEEYRENNKEESNGR
jgi:hypothetical protein